MEVSAVACHKFVLKSCGHNVGSLQQIFLRQSGEVVLKVK